MEDSVEQTRVYIFRPFGVSLADFSHLRVLVRFADAGQEYNIDRSNNGYDLVGHNTVLSCPALAVDGVKDIDYMY